MSQKQKLIAKLKSRPRDFTFEEAKSLLNHLGYYQTNKGKTSGSRVMFTSEQHETRITLHKPHPNNELPDYLIEQLIEQLSQEGLI